MSHLIVDGNNVQYAAYYAYNGLTSRDGKPSSIIFGMPSIVASLVNMLKPTKTTIVWDGKKSTYRLSVLPDYKKRDKKMDEDQLKNFYHEKSQVQEIFTHLGIRQVHSMEMEADDYIYYLTKKYSKKTNVTIVSNDKDFHQLLSPTVKIWSTSKKTFISTINCKKLFGYAPNQCVDFLSLIGDDSDNIPGLPGVGPKTAQAFLERFGSVHEFLLDPSNKFPRIDRNLLKEVYERNRRIIDLAWYYRNILNSDLKVKLLVRKPEYNPKELKKICRLYDINKFTTPEFYNQFSSLRKNGKTDSDSI